MPRRQAGTAVVAVAPGEGLAHLFESEGVYVVEGGPTENPSTADVLSAMLACPADHVVLLPNASQVSGVAEAAAIEARGQGIEVAVVPTKSPVQGLSAVAVHDASRHFGDDVIAMAEAAAATRWAEVTIAAARGAHHGRSVPAGRRLGPDRRRSRRDRIDGRSRWPPRSSIGCSRSAVN